MKRQRFNRYLAERTNMAKCFYICCASCCALSVPLHDPASDELPPASAAPNSHQYYPQLSSSK